MANWNYYVSGMKYAEIKTDGADAVIRSLDHLTGQFSAAAALDNDTAAPHMRTCYHMLDQVIASIPVYETHAASSPAEFTTAAGEYFQRKPDGSYAQRNTRIAGDLFMDGGSLYAIVFPVADSTAILVKEGYEDKTILARWKGQGFAFYPGLEQLPAAYVNTRDGISLATDVYLPLEAKWPLPAVLIRTPYSKVGTFPGSARFAHHGYALVIQDVRGREDSTGEWHPMTNEIEDGDDTLDWIAAQPWSDGSVGMTGGSYMGAVQWCAAASGNRHLKAMLSLVCAGTPFVDIPRRGGCMLSGAYPWAFAMGAGPLQNKEAMARTDWTEVLDIRPLRDIPEKATGAAIPCLTEWADHMEDDAYWYGSDWFSRNKGNVVPALISSGWFDDDGMGSTQALALAAKYPPGNFKAILGPWKHGMNTRYELHETFMGFASVRYDLDLISLMWLEHFLRGADNGIENTATVEYYAMNTPEGGTWKTAATWPVPCAALKKLYLNGSGDDCARENRGTFSARSPREGQDSFVYDPQNPAEHIIDLSENELEIPEDYARQELRPDYLVYTGKPLKEDTVVTGDITAHLFISSDCPDTDIMIRLCDVDPDGHSLKLADGILDVRFRNGFDRSELMRPGQVYPIRVTTTKISNTFRKGHRIRFTITSSAKGFVFPNTNTERGYDGTECRIARNTIHRGGKYASHILLPVEQA
jgi:putative CocE/NonD family hydrolase